LITSPKQRWENDGFLPQMVESVSQLDLLLFTIRKPRKVRRDGIHFQGLRYMDAVLADYVGEQVIIRYNPSDITSIRIFYDEKFLCQPICEALCNQSVSLKEIQTARNAKKRELHKQIKKRVSLVDAILRTKGNAFVSKEGQKSADTAESQKEKTQTRLKLYESDH